MELKKQVTKNTIDIESLNTNITDIKVDIKQNTNRINGLEHFILPELKMISKKIDNVKDSIWTKLLYAAAGVGFVSFVFIIVSNLNF